MFLTSMVAASTTRCCPGATPPCGTSVEDEDDGRWPDELSFLSGLMTVKTTTTNAIVAASSTAATIAGTRLPRSVLVSTMISLVQAPTSTGCDQFTSPAVSTA